MRPFQLAKIPKGINYFEILVKIKSIKNPPCSSITRKWAELASSDYSQLCRNAIYALMNFVCELQFRAPPTFR